MVLMAAFIKIKTWSRYNFSHQGTQVLGLLSGWTLLPKYRGTLPTNRASKQTSKAGWSLRTDKFTIVLRDVNIPLAVTKDKEEAAR